MKFSQCREIDAQVRELVRAGWTVEHGGKHKKIRAPWGKLRPIPGSPSDFRSGKNFAAQTRRLIAQQDG